MKLPRARTRSNDVRSFNLILKLEPVKCSCRSDLLVLGDKVHLCDRDPALTGLSVFKRMLCLIWPQSLSFFNPYPQVAPAGSQSHVPIDYVSV